MTRRMTARLFIPSMDLAARAGPSPDHPHTLKKDSGPIFGTNTAKLAGRPQSMRSQVVIA